MWLEGREAQLRRGGHPAGWGTRGSPLLRGAGARDADAPSWPARAPGGRRARAATDRYREGLRRQRAEPGAVSEERSDRERRERVEGVWGREREEAGDAPGRSPRPLRPRQLPGRHHLLAA